MSFLDRLFGKKLLAAVFSVLALSLLPAAAHADQFQYVFSGTASGLYDGLPAGDTPFTLTFVENTSSLGLDQPAAGYYEYTDISGTLVANGMTFILNGVTLEVNGNSGEQNVDFYDSAFTNGLGLSSPTLLGYNLMSNLDVPATTSDLTPTLGASSFAVSGGNTLQFTGDANLGFTATDLTPAATPEPSSLLLLGSGLSGLALLRRRFLKA